MCSSVGFALIEPQTMFKDSRPNDPQLLFITALHFQFGHFKVFVEFCQRNIWSPFPSISTRGHLRSGVLRSRGALPRWHEDLALTGFHPRDVRGGWRTTRSWREVQVARFVQPQKMGAVRTISQNDGSLAKEMVVERNAVNCWRAIYQGGNCYETSWSVFIHFAQLVGNRDILD